MKTTQSGVLEQVVTNSASPRIETDMAEQEVRSGMAGVLNLSCMMTTLAGYAVMCSAESQRSASIGLGIVIGGVVPLVASIGYNMYKLYDSLNSRQSNGIKVKE